MYTGIHGEKTGRQFEKDRDVNCSCGGPSQQSSDSLPAVGANTLHSLAT